MSIMTRAAVLLGLAFLVADVRASSTFTEEQRAEIARMIAEERERIRAEVRAELRAEYERAPRAEKPVARASSATPPLAVNGEAKAAPEQFLKNIGDSTFGRDVESGRSGFEIQSSNENSKASVKLGKVFSNIDGGNGTFSTLTLTASAPLDKTKDVTNIATLDGFANSFDVSLKYTNFLVTGLRTPDTAKLFAWCDRLGIDETKEVCDTNTVKEKLKAQGRLDLYGDFKSMFWSPKSWKLLYGGELKIGYEEFEFIDPLTLDARDEDETPWSIKAFGGVVPPGWNALISVGFEYQRAYKASRGATVCPAFPAGATQVSCLTGNIGAPTDQDKYLLSLEGRTELEGVGVSLRLTHDFEAGDSGVDLPIYLFRNAKGALNGGVRFGWTNTDHASVGVFAGTSFKLFQ